MTTEPALGGIRPATRVAWALTALGVVLAFATCVLAAVNGKSVVEFLMAHQGIALLIAVAFPLLGGLILTREPGNRLGWAVMTAGLLLGIYLVSVEVATLTDPRSAVGGAASWLSAWINLPGIVLSSTFPMLLFPDGRAPSRRWVPLAWLAIALAVVPPLVVAVLAWPQRGTGLGNTGLTGALGDAWAIAFGLGLLAFVPSAAALVLRFRRSTGVQRQQMKWFTYAVVVTIPLNFAGQLPGLLGPVLELLQFVALVIGIAVGVFRYRLYDIDRIINRTIVYGLLTALLAGAYAIGVLVLGQAVGSGEETPGLIVAATTLAVAAVFQPLRRAIQRAVDRRFNRRHYDAARTVDAFAGRLRQQVDLDALGTELLGVVDTTMAPATASLWLRERGGRRAPGP